MKIREYKVSDQEDVICLWQDCGLVQPQNNPEKDITRKLKVDPDLFLIGCVGDELVASVMGGYEGHRGWINYLAVTPSAQRKGYAQAIMATVESLLHAKGCPKINLQIRTNNQDVIAFYESLGYTDDRVVGMGKRLEID